MDIRLRKVEFAAIREAVIAHLATLPSAIDAFLEAHILESNHYQIDINDETAGFASIHGQRLITQFAIVAGYRRYGQAVFRSLRALEHVRAAFVPTCDEFFLSHALDEYRQINKQAYFFAQSTSPLNHQALTLHQATPADQTLIHEQSAGFFICDQRGLRPIAGCWYYNHGSKKTLERAGMFTQTRLLNIEY